MDVSDLSSVHVCSSMDDVWSLVDEGGPLAGTVDTVWNMGGVQVYKQALGSDRLHRLYVIEMDLGSKGCDTFLRDVTDWSSFAEVPLPTCLPAGTQSDQGYTYRYRCFEKIKKMKQHV